MSHCRDRRLKGRRRAGGDDRAGVVAVAVLAAVGEPIEHQEVEHLVFPRGRRREESAPCGQRIEIDVGDACSMDGTSRRAAWTVLDGRGPIQRLKAARLHDGIVRRVAECGPSSSPSSH